VRQLLETLESRVLLDALPSPFLHQDIGSPSLNGDASYDAETTAYSLSAAGTDIAGTSDQFHFAYQTLTGDGSLVVRISSLTNTNAAAKAGLMFRDSLNAAGSRYGDVSRIQERRSGNCRER